MGAGWVAAADEDAGAGASRPEGAAQVMAMTAPAASSRLALRRRNLDVGMAHLPFRGVVAALRY